jgi:hypothetical protein
MKLQATYVSADEFDGQYFEVSFDTEAPDADIDLSAPLKPYLLIQRQFEDDDGGVCYIETHEPDGCADDSGVITPTVPEISRPPIPGLSRPPVPELSRPSIPELFRPPVEAA